MLMLNFPVPGGGLIAINPHLITAVSISAEGFGVIHTAGGVFKTSIGSQEIEEPILDKDGTPTGETRVRRLNGREAVIAGITHQLVEQQERAAMAQRAAMAERQRREALSNLGLGRLGPVPRG